MAQALGLSSILILAPTRVGQMIFSFEVPDFLLENRRQSRSLYCCTQRTPTYPSKPWSSASPFRMETVCYPLGFCAPDLTPAVCHIRLYLYLPPHPTPPLPGTSACSKTIYLLNKREQTLSKLVVSSGPPLKGDVLNMLSLHLCAEYRPGRLLSGAGPRLRDRGPPGRLLPTLAWFQGPQHALLFSLLPRSHCRPNRPPACRCDPEGLLATSWELGSGMVHPSQDRWRHVLGRRPRGRAVDLQAPSVRLTPLSHPPTLLGLQAGCQVRLTPGSGEIHISQCGSRLPTGEL